MQQQKNKDPPGRKLRNGINRRPLRPTHRHDLLGNTDTPTAHPNPQRVRARHNQLRRLFPRDYITRNHLQPLKRLFDPLDKFDLVVGVALGRIEHDNVQAGFYEQGEAVFVGRPGPDGCAAVELLGRRHFGCEGVVLVFEQIGTRDERDEVARGIDDGQFTAFRVSEDRVGLFERRARGSSNEVLGHDLGERCRRIAELDITSSNDTDKFTPHLARLCDRHTGEPECVFDIEDVPDSVARRETERIGDESVFELLDFAHHGCLLFGGTVVVDDTETAVEGQGDGHAVFGDRVHGRGEEGGVEENVAGHPGG